MKDYESIARKITRTLFLSQSVVSAALITTGTVNAIAGAELSGVIAWAGVPTTVLLVAAALGALTWGFVMERIGRRGGLAIGLVLGALGALSAGFALWPRIIPPLPGRHGSNWLCTKRNAIRAFRSR